MVVQERNVKGSKNKNMQISQHSGQEVPRVTWGLWSGGSIDLKGKTILALWPSGYGACKSSSKRYGLLFECHLGYFFQNIYRAAKHIKKSPNMKDAKMQPCLTDTCLHPNFSPTTDMSYK
jgi:hypothetical protein